MELWIARDKDGRLHLYRNKPRRYECGVVVYFDAATPNLYSYPIDRNIFPELTCENSPKKVRIELIEDDDEQEDKNWFDNL